MTGVVYEQLVFGTGTTHQERFETFHALNPWVYSELVRMARELVARGRRKIGIKMLVEVLRWTYYLRTQDPNSSFRLNNNLTSRYARLIMDQEADLAGIFELRELQAA